MQHEEKYGKGAIEDTLDNRDVQYSHIAMGTPEFDWQKGYDVEEELSVILNIPNFKKPVKDQDGSGSCGGQAWGYYGATLEAIATETYEERSAKFIYAQTHVMPAGSAGRTNCDLVISQGWATEVSCPSYDGGVAPGEAFMQRVGDITQEARDTAKIAKALLYANVGVNIDLLAQAIRDNHGTVIGVNGKNNGTWASKFPLAPDTISGSWAHWLYGGKAKMINGKKYIGILNSWGKDVGDSGWQWIGEDYFKLYSNVSYAIFSIWTMVFKGKDPDFSHKFTAVLKVGSSGDEVTSLQKALNLEGMFKGTIDGKYGLITKASVKAFQTRYNLTVDGWVGPKTNAKLNQLYSK